MDFNLYQNNVRYKFSDSPVLSVSITENEEQVIILVSTVCSLHRLEFSHPDVLADSSTANGNTKFNESQSCSIFQEANTVAAKESNSFYVIEPHGTASG